MRSIFQFLIQTRVRIEGTSVWKVATKSRLRIFFSAVGLFVLMLPAIIIFPLVYFYVPFLSLVVIAYFLVIMALIRLLVNEAKRQSKAE